MINPLRKIVPQWVKNSFWHLPIAILANVLYGFPSRKLIVIGVTGTDGKTTTVNMIYQILKDSGQKVGMVSTINAFVGGKSIDTGFHVTSPDPELLQKILRESLDNGDEVVVLEVTSHALDQHRFWGVKFDIGVITNITHEHLDYHKRWESYFLAKAKLIKDVEYGILNKEEGHFGRLKKMSSGKIISFGFSKEADFNPDNFPLNLKILGKFNVLNALAASAVTFNLGIDKKVIKKALENFEHLLGRMDKIPNRKGLNIYIDFAHTPNALKVALEALRKEHKNGKIIAVFGCAGLRDEQKRPLMGEVAASLADYVVITAEDPRGLIDEINGQILKGAIKAGGKLEKDVFIEEDRKRAISFAVNTLGEYGDIIGIFGKGHERSMNIDGKKEIPWSDHEVVKEILKNGQ